VLAWLVLTVSMVLVVPCAGEVKATAANGAASSRAHAPSPTRQSCGVLGILGMLRMGSPSIRLRAGFRLQT
jgi:hypothetical protein